MGAYKIEKICDDFDVVMKGFGNNISEKMKAVAIEIMSCLPDNKGRDLAISNLLYSAEFMKASILEEAVTHNKQIHRTAN